MVPKSGSKITVLEILFGENGGRDFRVFFYIIFPHLRPDFILIEISICSYSLIIVDILIYFELTLRNVTLT
jgi:hypothetical protein